MTFGDCGGYGAVVKPMNGVVAMGKGDPLTWFDVVVAVVLVVSVFKIPFLDLIGLFLIAGGITVILDAFHCYRTLNT